MDTSFLQGLTVETEKILNFMVAERENEESWERERE